jgi:hypothetical protein
VRWVVFSLTLSVASATALAQFNPESEAKGPRLDRQEIQRIKVGVIIKAAGGTIQGVTATAPVPAEWPEQRVRIVAEDVSSSIKSLTYRTLTGGGGLKQMVVEIPRLPAGQEARALITFEVTRRALAAPSRREFYTIPKKLDREMLLNVGTSPYIESRHPKIVAAAKEAVADKESAWEKTEAIYDWVRDHVAYRHGELKGAARALHDKEGGADELTSLFIAMCRAQKIPARTVFVLGHCYAEFYLEDDQGQGHWFPCQPAGIRAFGGIDDVNPILQKGDNFKNPENSKERQRYVTEYFHASGRGQEPKVRFVSELVAE